MLGELEKKLKQLSNSRHYLIAYSGGLDSHVLLHALTTLKKQGFNCTIRAVHVHHGLSPAADHWQQHCKKVCEKLNVEYITEDITLQLNAGDSVEALARTGRYAVFAKHLQSQECLLTAHTENDQAETLLLQLMRGAGVRGLSSMPEIKLFAAGEHARPLLEMTRSQLEEYAQEHKLQWIEDESNNNERYDRNYIRHNTLPALKKRWPAVFKNLARSARHFASAEQLLVEFAQCDFERVNLPEKNQLNINELLTLSVARQINVIRFWLQHNNVLPPSEKKMQHILSDVLQARQGANPIVEWAGVQCRRFQSKLYVINSPASFDATMIIPWDVSEALELPAGLGVLRAEPINTTASQSKFDCSKLTVRFRQGGERLLPAGRQGTHTLKKLFQQWGVPPWQRDRLPLVFCDDVLIAVPGYCHVADFPLTFKITI